MSSQSSQSWQPWQLTAYVLGELEADEMQRLASAIASDPALRREVSELAATLKDVRAVYRQEKIAHDQACPIDQQAMSARLAAESSTATRAPHVVSTKPLGARRSEPNAWRSRSVRLSLAAVLLVGISLGFLWRGAMQPSQSTAMARRDFDADRSSAGQVQDADRTGAPAESLALRQSEASTIPSDGLAELDESTTTSDPVLNSDLMAAAAHDQRIGRPAASGPAGAAAPLAAGGMGMADGSDYGMGGYGAPSAAYGSAAPSMGASTSASTSLGVGASRGMGYTGAPAEPAGSSGSGAVLGGNGMAASTDSFGSEASMAFGGSSYGPGDRFAPLTENDFAEVRTAPLSTFSIDVDTASFAKARQYLLEHRQMPPADSVRIEEFINYFDYDYEGPTGDAPFASALAVAQCPWQPRHKLVRIALQAMKVDLAKRPPANLVFLLDVSGSMNEPNKLPLVKETMRLLSHQLGESDRVAMVVYAGAAGCVLESTRGDQRDEILSAIERLSAGGSTNGGQGIELAYRLAREHFIPGGINRVILCTDGDFNVGVTSTAALVDLVAQNAKSNVFLTVLGYGMGNTNDAMMEQISDRGNGVYGFVDSRSEAQRQMVQQLAGTLMTVAKDVKIQVEFNPALVRSYRLIGYENRLLAAQDFNNDQKDAGEIGAGHRVTALYEIVPASAESDAAQAVAPLKYQPAAESTPAAPATYSRELLTVKLRYKQPEGDKSSLLSFPLEDSDLAFTDADGDFRWAAAVAEFGMLLRGSQHKGTASWDSVARRARMAAGANPDRSRSDCLEMIGIAAQNAPSASYSFPGMSGGKD